MLIFQVIVKKWSIVERLMLKFTFVRHGCSDPVLWNPRHLQL